MNEDGKAFLLLRFFLVCLTLIFITLKLIGYLSWSWLWVLAPLWIPFALGLIIVFFIFVYYLIKAFRDR